MSNKERSDRPWTRYQNGDHFTDEELATMIRQAEAALPYLQARAPFFYLAVTKTLTDLSFYPQRVPRVSQTETLIHDVRYL
jgi:hypothetical protein